MKVVVIGSSAGGPDVLKKLFSKLNSVGSPIVVAQHNISSNAEDFARWLSQHTSLKISLVSGPETLKPSTVYLTSGKGDLYFPSKETVSIKKSSSLVSPSIDVLFESAAEVFKNDTIGIILSGLGRDGARGVRRILEEGGRVIVQKDAKFSYLPNFVESENEGVIKRSLDEIALMLMALL